MSLLSCQRCKQTSNSPQAFLLTCRGCRKTWHHRCHMPPVGDEELLQLLRATNHSGTNDGLGTWICRRCKRSTLETSSIITSSHEPTVSSESHHDQKSSISTHTPVPGPDYDTTPPASRVASEQAMDVLEGREPGLERGSTHHFTSPPSVPQSVGADAQPPSRLGQEQDEDSDRRGVQTPADIVPATLPDDDPEDLYGPPVERRIVRILPSLAEELREQQRRATAEKAQEKRRAPLAPDWIFARHALDPLWKEIRPTSQGRRRLKPTARRLGDNGLNISELLGYLTLQNTLREHKT